MPNAQSAYQVSERDFQGSCAKPNRILQEINVRISDAVNRIAAVTVPTFVDNEEPQGTVGGGNTDFFLSQAPNPTDSLILVLTGAVKLQGTDYNLVGKKITFAVAPASGWLRAWYRV